MALDSKSSKWDDQINKLKELREKKEKGLDYKIEDVLVTKREQNNKSGVNISAKIKTDIENNPYVRRVTLDELINASRIMKGEKPLSHEKKTPFINREKEIKPPQLDKGGM